MWESITPGITVRPAKSVTWVLGREFSLFRWRGELNKFRSVTNGYAQARNVSFRRLRTCRLSGHVREG
jgi:hypothetical protein